MGNVQEGFKTCRETRDQTANIHWIIEKARKFQRNICFIDCAKAFDCVDHNKLWKILQEMGIPDHLTCFLKNLYAGHEATGHGKTDWFQIGKGVHQGYILSLCLFNLYAEYMRVHAKSLQLCLTLWVPVDYSLTGFSVHGILQARTLKLLHALLQGIFPT